MQFLYHKLDVVLKILASCQCNPSHSLPTKKLGLSFHLLWLITYWSFCNVWTKGGLSDLRETWKIVERRKFYGRTTSEGRSILNRLYLKTNKPNPHKNYSIQIIHSASFPFKDHFCVNFTAPSKGIKMACICFTIIINMAKLHNLERILHIILSIIGSYTVPLPKPQCNTLHFEASKSPNYTLNHTVNGRCWEEKHSISFFMEVNMIIYRERREVGLIYSYGRNIMKSCSPWANLT